MSDDFRAANIVFQIGDLLEAPAAKRQETNDQAITFVNKLLRKHTAEYLRQLQDDADEVYIKAWLERHIRDLDPDSWDRCRAEPSGGSA